MSSEKTVPQRLLPLRAYPPMARSQDRSNISRRAALASGVGFALTGRVAAEPSALPVAPSLFVAGPVGGRLDHWAALIGAPLGKSLLQTASVGRENVGGPDGVTGVNQFQALTTSDGATALLMPGTAALSWLVGDPRVRFEAGRWAPIWGGEASAVVASRVPLAPGQAGGQPVRVAVRDLVGPELAVLLALELLGIAAVAVPVDAAAAGAPPAFSRPDVDLVLLRGASLRRDAAELAGRRWTLPFGLGMLGDDATVARDPAFASIPTVYEFVERSRAERTVELAAALRAVGAAAALDIALVLPLLSPAAAVAWWRQGCATLSNTPEVQAEAARVLMRPVDAGATAASFSSITAESTVLLALRRWLAERHQWRPG